MWTANDPAGKRGMAWSLLFRSRFILLTYTVIITNHFLYQYTTQEGGEETTLSSQLNNKLKTALLGATKC